MRVFTLIGEEHEMRPMAKRIEHEGHKVVITQDVMLHPRPDCIVSRLGLGAEMDKLRKEGYTVIGSSRFGDSIELDYHYALRFMKLSELTPLTDDVEGVQVEMEAWFNGVNVIGTTMKFKDQKLMDGDIGPKANMGLALLKGDIRSRLYKETLEKVIPHIRKVGFRGSFRLSCLVTKDKIYISVINTHLDVNAFYEIYIGRLNDLLYGVGSGVLVDIKMKDDWAVGITLAQVQNPQYINMNVEGLNKHNMKHMWLYAIVNEKITKNDGRLAVVTAKGGELREARRRAYRTIGNLKIPDVMYRRDIGHRVYNDYAQLKKWKWV